MNPEITKMEHFTIIVNSIWPFAIVAKSFILNAVRFLDTPLHCNKSAPKAVGWFKPGRMVMCTCIPWGEYLNKLGKNILGSLILLNL